MRQFVQNREIIEPAPAAAKNFTWRERDVRKFIIARLFIGFVFCEPQCAASDENTAPPQSRHGFNRHSVRAAQLLPDGHLGDGIHKAATIIDIVKTLGGFFEFFKRGAFSPISFSLVIIVSTRK